MQRQPRKVLRALVTPRLERPSAMLSLRIILGHGKRVTCRGVVLGNTSGGGLIERAALLSWAAFSLFDLGGHCRVDSRCLFKTPKGRERPEIFAPPPYRRGHDHNSFHRRFHIRLPASRRASLELELIALRHQVSVLWRQRPSRIWLFSTDRLLWVGFTGFGRRSSTPWCW